MKETWEVGLHSKFWMCLQCMLWSESLLCFLPSLLLSPKQVSQRWALPSFYLSGSMAALWVIDFVTPTVLIRSLSTACLQPFGWSFLFKVKALLKHFGEPQLLKSHKHKLVIWQRILFLHNWRNQPFSISTYGCSICSRACLQCTWLQ